MYQVTIRKMYRHADGSTVLYEDPAHVNHERHAENLAARIARDPGVEWVEVEEVGGWFKARAHLGRDGIVQACLESKGYAVRRSTRRRRKRPRYVWAILAILTLLGLLKLLITGK
jgi:hypothetical protein